MPGVRFQVSGNRHRNLNTETSEHKTGSSAVSKSLNENNSSKIPDFLSSQGVGICIFHFFLQDASETAQPLSEEN